MATSRCSWLNSGHTLWPLIDPTQIPLGYASDAAALDVGLGLGAGKITIKRCIDAIFSRAAYAHIYWDKGIIDG